jgi:F0F1-type ATP synthase membrane subunit b/b'
MHAKKQFAGINLSDEQKKKAKELNESYQKQFAELRKNSSMTIGDYRTKTAALKKEQHEKFQALLTPEQKTQIADTKKEQGSKNERRPGEAFR